MTIYFERKSRKKNTVSKDNSEREGKKIHSSIQTLCQTDYKKKK